MKIQSKKTKFFVISTFLLMGGVVRSMEEENFQSLGIVEHKRRGEEVPGNRTLKKRKSETNFDSLSRKDEVNKKEAQDFLQNLQTQEPLAESEADGSKDQSNQNSPASKGSMDQSRQESEKNKKTSLKDLYNRLAKIALNQSRENTEK